VLTSLEPAQNRFAFLKFPDLLTMVKSYSFQDTVNIEKFKFRTDLKVQLNGKTKWVKLEILQGPKVEKKVRWVIGRCVWRKTKTDSN